MKLGTWVRAEWDRIAGFGLVALGALFVLLGYLGVRNTPFVAEQMAYMASGGIGGLFSLGFGVGLLLSADLHDEWRKLDRIEAELRGEAVPEPEPLSDPAEPDTKAQDSDAAEPAIPPAPTTNGRLRPDAVPQSAGTAGVLAVALSHPAGGTRRALAALSLALLLPFLVAGSGWWRASQTADMDVAARGLGLAVAAIAAGLVLVALWGLWMRVSVLRRRANVTRALRRWNGNRLSADQAAARPIGDGVNFADDVVFVASGHPRFHRAGCAALEWIDAVPVARLGVDVDLIACGLCQA